MLIDAPEDLKNVIGPTAYVVNGVRAIGHRTTRFGVSIDGGPPRWCTARRASWSPTSAAWSAASTSRPEAEVSDGRLHVVVLPFGYAARPAAALRATSAADGAARHSRRHYEGRSAVIVSRETQPRARSTGDVVEDGWRRPGAAGRPWWCASRWPTHLCAARLPILRM